MQKPKKIQKSQEQRSPKKQRASTSKAIRNGEAQEKLPEKTKGHVEFNRLAIGDWFSTISYTKVVGIGSDNDGEYAEVENQHGDNYLLYKEVIELESFSGSQFNQIVKTNRSNIEKILRTSGKDIFTINFMTKPTEERAREILSGVSEKELREPSSLRRIAKDLVSGRESTITGYLLDQESMMGRSLVIDLNLPAKENIRLVDHRSINWMIFRGVKYVVK